MTAKEAKAILAASPFKDGQEPARVNKGLTQAQSHKIISDWISELPDDTVLKQWMIKRVRQVSENLCRCDV